MDDPCITARQNFTYWMFNSGC